MLQCLVPSLTNSRITDMNTSCCAQAVTQRNLLTRSDLSRRLNEHHHGTVTCTLRLILSLSICLFSETVRSGKAKDRELSRCCSWSKASGKELRHKRSLSPHPHLKASIMGINHLLIKQCYLIKNAQRVEISLITPDLEPWHFCAWWREGSA